MKLLRLLLIGAVLALAWPLTSSALITHVGSQGGPAYVGGAERPTLRLAFADTGALDSRITYTGGANRTLINSAGDLVYADHNLLSKSEEFDHGDWVRNVVSVTANSEGIAELAQPSGSDGTLHQVIAASVGQTHTFSVELKRVGGSDVTLAIRLRKNSNSAAYASNTSVTATADWQRFTITGTVPSGETNIQATIGGGNVWLIGEDILIRKGQLRFGSSAGTYVPTTTTAVWKSRFTHLLSDATPLGLSIWEGRKNDIRTNDTTGASTGTPGTPPNNWTITAGGTTVELVAVDTVNGIKYVSYKFSGTPSGNPNVQFEGIQQIAALTAEIWTQSAYIALIAGDLTNISEIRFNLDEYTNASGFLRGNPGTDFKGSLTSSLIRFSKSITLSGGATTAFVHPYLQIVWDGSGAIDLTLRIGLPQEEQGAGASPVIKTTNAAVTATADMPTIPVSAFGFNQSEGTILVVGLVDTINVGQTRNVFQIDDGGTTDRILLNIGSGTDDLIYRTENSGGDNGFTSHSGVVAGTSFEWIGTYANDDLASSMNGAVVQTDATAGLPTTDALTTFNIGTRNGGTAPLNGTIKLIEYWNVRLPDGRLQDRTMSLDMPGNMFAANDNEEWREAVGW